jgi:hypothetical protein
MEAILQLVNELNKKLKVAKRLSPHAKRVQNSLALLKSIAENHMKTNDVAIEPDYFQQCFNNLKHAELVIQSIEEKSGFLRPSAKEEGLRECVDELETSVHLLRDIYQQWVIGFAQPS